MKNLGKWTFFSNREVLQNQRFSFGRKQWVRRNQSFFTSLLKFLRHVSMKAVSSCAETSSLVLSEAAFLWRAYCEMNEPVIENPAVYAAALRYLASEMAGREFVNIEDVSKRYGVPVEEVEATVMELFLFRTELLDDGDDEGENDDEWLFDDGDDGDEIWFDDGGMEDGDELDRAIEEWLDQVEELFDREGWDVDQVHRLIDKAVRTWKKDGLLEGVDATELRKELEELVWETFAERGFL
ncbi:SEC-C motif domain protein [Geobacillus sp. GHH01]|nr:SEC-C motif domain protein [Geobacillus sp. GHH01]